MKINIGMKIGFVIEFIGLFLMIIFYQMIDAIPTYIILVIFLGAVVAVLSMIVSAIRNNKKR